MIILMGKYQPMISSGSNSVSNRLLSIDALRGFDMFFISGGGTCIYRLAEAAYATLIDGLAIIFDITFRTHLVRTMIYTMWHELLSCRAWK